MDAATWVALILGMGSLSLTIVLDKRNRDERVALDRAERSERLTRERRDIDERERTRWLGDRKSTYLAYLDAVEARASRLHMLLIGVTYGYDSNSEAGHLTDSSDQARSLSLLAPTSISDSVHRLETLLKSAEWSAQISSMEAKTPLRDAANQDDHSATYMANELEEVSAEIAALRSAMRDDLGVA